MFDRRCSGPSPGKCTCRKMGVTKRHHCAPVVDEGVELRAVGGEHLTGGPAREPHQQVEEDVRDEEDEGEGGGAAR